jgi:hypothetical protein
MNLPVRDSAKLSKRDNDWVLKAYYRRILGQLTALRPHPKLPSANKGTVIR